VSGGDLEACFASGLLRATIAQGSFRISKSPISHEQFGECQTAGGCGSTEGTCAPMRAGKQPAWCVGREGAEAFCRWVGGRLPTLNEWLFAARGSAVRKYSWGDSLPNCAQHPLAGRRAGSDGETAACDEALSARSYRMGRHPEGASPFSVEDVLLAPNELVGASDSALLPACQEAACFVYGLSPGAIDSVRSFSEPELEEPWAGAAPDGAYAFRCVWEVSP
jgi:hypothetical protein